ncbi:cupin domain-containing protein [Ktedonosporobacter rubrisoli]|uniref:Cupin domain-containing protein n=1 Tax=Ktedonosporobacter rubrisoli TaxID=2509675 RepID=A0A4P6JQF7_KTERU|nr:cupin domain-containing protein [Ktedonosporobacter rubrisoli]QBD77372.1 cupin domain-containing protein [Ktedonosporobacter rubrisoli]
MTEISKDAFVHAVILKAGEGRTIPLGPIQMLVQEDGTHTRGTLGIAELSVAPHAPTPPPHFHRTFEESFYVLEGELEFLAGTKTLRAGAGTFVMVPIGAVHTFSNPTGKAARFLNTFTPPRYLGYFEELSQLIQAGVTPDSRQFAELMARYDTVVVS